MEQHRKNLIILAGTTVMLLVVVVTLTLALQKPASNHIYDSNGKLQYTNAITGRRSNDIPGESPFQLTPPVALPNVTIDGTDQLSTYLTADQAAYVTDWITSYLEARSQQLFIQGGIEQNSFSQSNNTLTFTLVVLEPQVTYAITVTGNSTLVSPTIKASREVL